MAGPFFMLEPMRVSQILVTVAITLWLATPAFPHGGGLDAYGCHHDRKRGGYRPPAPEATQPIVPTTDWPWLEQAQACEIQAVTLNGWIYPGGQATGVVYGLTMRKEVWVAHGVPPIHIPESVRAVLIKEGVEPEAI